MYQKSEYQLIKSRLEEPRKFIQVVMGPRQVGKTTTVKQVLKTFNGNYLFFSADDVAIDNSSWVSDCWESARALKESRGYSSMILAIDEIQKIQNWSEAVKKEWDFDTFNDIDIKILLLGSSRVLLEKGLSESLAGRFEEIRMTHWDYQEMRECFNFTLNQYLFFGGYPGAAQLTEDRERWASYIQSSIIDATINKDILMNTQIRNTALLRQVLVEGSHYSGEELSSNKMLGLLQKKGNAETIITYTNLLKESGLLCGLQKYSNDDSRTKGSVPKYQVFNNALKTANTPISFEQALSDRKLWGRIYESAVGAWLINMGFKHHFDVFYWRNGTNEVDFVLRKAKSLIAIEVKSNRTKETEGLNLFKETFKPDKAFIVGDGGIPLQDFFSMDIMKLFSYNKLSDAKETLIIRNNNIIALEKETADYARDHITNSGLNTGIKWVNDSFNELWRTIKELNSESKISDDKMLSEEIERIIRFVKPKHEDGVRKLLLELGKELGVEIKTGIKIGL